MTVIQFQTSCLQLVFTSGIPCNSERDQSVHLDLLHTLLCRSLFAFVCWLCSFVFVPLWNNNKSYCVSSLIFSQEREWQLNIKSMKMSIRVVQSFNIIVWSTPFLKWPNLKCHVVHMTHFDQFLYWTLLGVFLLSHLCHWLKYHLSQILLLFWIVQVKYPPRYQ